MSFKKDLQKVQETLDSVKTENKDIIPRLKTSRKVKYEKILYYIGNPRYELSYTFVLNGYSVLPFSGASMDGTLNYGRIHFSALDNLTRGNYAISQSGDRMELEKSLAIGKIDRLEIDRNRIWLRMHGYSTWFDADWFFDHDLTKMTCE